MNQFIKTIGCANIIIYSNKHGFQGKHHGRVCTKQLRKTYPHCGS